jgi:hypothetical protein
MGVLEYFMYTLSPLTLTAWFTCVHHVLSQMQPDDCWVYLCTVLYIMYSLTSDLYSDSWVCLDSMLGLGRVLGRVWDFTYDGIRSGTKHWNYLFVNNFNQSITEVLPTIFVGLQGGDGPIVLLYLSLDSLNFIVSNKLWTLK